MCTGAACPDVKGLYFEHNGRSRVVLVRDGKFKPPVGGWFVPDRKYYVTRESDTRTPSLASASTSISSASSGNKTPAGECQQIVVYSLDFIWISVEIS